MLRDSYKLIIIIILLAVGLFLAIGCNRLLALSYKGCVKLSLKNLIAYGVTPCPSISVPLNPILGPSVGYTDAYTKVIQKGCILMPCMKQGIPGQCLPDLKDQRDANGLSSLVMICDCVTSNVQSGLEEPNGGGTSGSGSGDEPPTGGGGTSLEPIFKITPLEEPDYSELPGVDEYGRAPRVQRQDLPSP